MSKYEDFVIMKSFVFLLLLGFIQLVYCNHDLNITDYDSYSVCPVRFFRRKRAFPEYTRWRSNPETTNEFLVKVLDEDITTAATQQIVAVNIMPVAKRNEKIIIGGAKVPPPTTSSSTTESLKDYTRFVPPTTAAVTRVDGDLYLAPVPPPTVINPIVPVMPIMPPILPPIKGSQAVRHAQRDDSPPASPQFLARTSMLMARQYAPIAPVAFTRRTTNTIGPVTPPSTTPYDEELFMNITPSRTPPFLELTFPARTTTEYNEFQTFHAFEDDASDHMEITRTTHYIPERTNVYPKKNSISSINELEFDMDVTTDRTNLADTRRREEEIKKVAEKDIESSYNMMFYNDEDSDANSKKDKDDQDIIDSYYDKKVNPEVVPDVKENEFDTDTKNTSFIKDFHIYPDDFVTENNTTKTPSRGVVGIPGIEIATLKPTNDKLRDKRRPVCNLLKLRQLNFNSPRTLPEIVNQMKQWAEDSPVAKWVDITEGNFTTMENPIYMMMVDDPSSGQIISAKQTVMIVAGIQGRDHHAVAAAMYVLYQLIERSEAHADLLTKYRFWIIPVFNPDGYDYSMTFPHRREWPKNLRQLWDSCRGRETCQACETRGIRCTIQPCYGVNLDRNFEYQWIPAEELETEHPCGPLYAGVRQLSEAETKAFTHYLHGVRTQLFTFIAFKEGDVLGIMYPYSHTLKKRAFDHIYRQRASRAASAAYSISNRPYVAGQTSEFLPLYAGGIEDWVDGHLGIDNTFTIMMFRPTDSYNTKLITERVVHEAYAAMDTLLLQSLENTQRPLSPIVLTKTGSATALMALPRHLMAIIPMIILYNG